MRGQSPPERTLLQGACAGGGAGRRPHLQTPHSIEPLPPQMLPSLLASRHWHSHWGRTRTVTVSVKPSARMVKDCCWMHSVAVTFTFQCSCLEKPRDGGACWAAVYGVAESYTTEATQSLGQEDLEEVMATHSSILAWRIL